MWKAILPLALALIGQAAGQTVYLAGDSTMAPGGGGTGTEGKAVSLTIVITMIKDLCEKLTTDPYSFLRLGPIPALFPQYPCRQQGLCWTFCPQLHTRRSIRRDRKAAPERRLRRYRIRPQ